MPHRLSAAQVGPLAFQLEVEFLDRLTEPVRDKKAKSVSDIIRTALERYDFTHMVVVRAAHVLVSVRLPVEIRRTLKKTARAKHTSVGQLVRTAVEAYLPQLETETAGQLEMPIVEPPVVQPDASPAAKPAAKSRRRPAPKRPAKVAAPKSKPARPAKAKPAARLMTKKRKG